MRYLLTADEFDAATALRIGLVQEVTPHGMQVDAALAIGCDYVIIDGRGGATGAAPRIFRDNISVPTIPALARARRHLDACNRPDVTLIITGVASTWTRPLPMRGAVCSSPTSISAEPLRPTVNLDKSTIAQT